MGGKKVGGEKVEARLERRVGSGVRGGIRGWESTLGIRVKGQRAAGLAAGGGCSGAVGLVLQLRARSEIRKKTPAEIKEYSVCVRARLCTRVCVRVFGFIRNPPPIPGRGNGFSRLALQQLIKDLRVRLCARGCTRVYGWGCTGV